MLKDSGRYDDIYNYRNSKYFIRAVLEAKKAIKPSKDVVIFAGACQSFFEAIMAARSKLCIFSCKDINRLYGSSNSCRKNCNYK